VYLDTDKLKSIIAQIEHGLSDTTSQLKSKDSEISLEGEGSLFGFLKSVAGAKYVWQNQATETKTLHDNIYNRVEDALISNDLLVTIPGTLQQENITNSEFTSLIDDTSFILAKGRININDFTQMRLMLDNFNELARFIALCNFQSTPLHTSKTNKKQMLRKAQDELTVDEPMLDGFKLIFDLFYKDRVVIKMLPFVDCPDFRLVGNLKPDLLRENISSITYKYGTAPVSDWTVFAQVASIPPKDRSNNGYNIGGANMEVALHGMFNAFREVELLSQSVVYPEIAITPIAIYRE
jgi:hypothetical protein